MTTIQAILGLDRGSLVFHPEGLSASFTESDVREAYEALPDEGVVNMVFTTQAEVIAAAFPGQYRTPVL
jgi:hypothetical protein